MKGNRSIYANLSYERAVEEAINQVDFNDDALIYANLQNNYPLKAQIIKESLRYVLNLIPDLAVRKTYCKLVDMKAPQIYTIIKETKRIRIDIAFTLALVNSILLKFIYKNSPEYKMDKICDVLFLNTDKYNSEDLYKAQLILFLLGNKSPLQKGIVSNVLKDF